ncbi:hypothetical protein [Alkalithermobacter paradoxus]|uniref:Uncharacterized protein n=1 Tax=Alkalithermobacter paradoxus TaxID=29349 RepID=A0A1V4I5R9_9FIRM|nr:hypothetical protein CLOTH_16060 [[Clostridium] thermoalcaliphilum]
MEDKILSILQQMQSDMSEMKGDIKSLKSDVELIKIQQNEHTQILKALQHSSETNSNDIEDLALKISKVYGKVSLVQNDLNMIEYVTANNMANIAMLKRKKNRI